MKRLLAFLLLATLGFLALRFAIGDDPSAAAPAASPTKRPAPVTPAPGTPTSVPPTEQAVPVPPASGVPVQQGQITATVTQSGPLEMPRFRPIKQPDGSVRNERTFLLRAADSRPIEGGLQQLDGVEVLLYDRGNHGATLTATRAFLLLGRDANGRPSIDETKEFDLRDAVLVTLPASRTPGLRLDLGNAKVVITDGEIVLTTLPDQLVTMTMAGNRPFTLRGLGAQARLPRDSTSASQRADIELLRDPVFESAGIVVRGKGRLHYREQQDTGAARLTIDDDVQMDVTSGTFTLPGMARRPADAAATTTQPTMVRGDQFNAWLQRSDDGGGNAQAMVWRQLVLTGAPATVELAGGKLLTPRLTVLPGVLGDPFLITAHGGESRIEQLELRPGATPEERVVATGKRRIHLVRPGDHIGALHRGMGFPQWSLRALHERQVVLVEGEARFTSGTRTLDAKNGMRAFRRDNTDSGIVQGLGAVRVEQPATASQPALLGNGSDGLWLRSDGTREAMRLGPAAPGDDEMAATAWREHRYEVHYGDMTLRGRGNCDLERDGTTTKVWLFAPTAAITADMPGDGLRMSDVRQLRATLLDRELQALDVAGWPVQLHMARGGEVVHATAPRMLQIAPRSLRLLPAPAEAPPGLYRELAEANRLPKLLQQVTAKGQQAEVRGPQIDLHHAGGRTALVDAIRIGDERPTMHASLVREGDKDSTTLACEAGRLRLLPFVVAPTVHRHLARTAGWTLTDLTLHSLAKPWLLLHDVNSFELDDPSEGHVEGKAHELLLSQGAKAALFCGDPDQLTPAEVHRRHQGRTVSLRGARVRVFHDVALRLQASGTYADRSTFLPPELTLRESAKSGHLSHMRAACRGNIEVRPEAIVFLGPVVIDSLDDNGAVLADGMHIDARELQLLRLSNGDVARVVAQGVQLDWPRLSATSQKLEIDLLRNLAIADDPAGATVTLPNTMTWQSPHIEVDYMTYAVRTHRGRGTRSQPPVEASR